MADRVRGGRGHSILALLAVLIVAPATSVSDPARLRPSARCATWARRFADRWRHAPRTCVVDTDCDCYPVDIERFCAQEAVDAPTSRALDALHTRYLADHCPDRASYCSPYYCSARCTRGRCTNPP